jgi:hypothetical protein
MKNNFANKTAVSKIVENYTQKDRQNGLIKYSKYAGEELISLKSWLKGTV